MKIERNTLYKERNRGYYNFDIELVEGKFSITFAGNGDLYWNYKASSDEIRNLDRKTFTVGMQDYFLYSLINELYERIKNYDIYSGFDDEEITEEYKEELKNRLMEKDEYNSERLFQNGVIDYHSDDYSYEDSARLVIEKLMDSFRITFVKGIDDIFPTFAVRIRNSGSSYDPFNICFMTMYHKLISYNPNYQYELSNQELEQISIDEYLDGMKLVRKKDEKRDLQ